MIQRIQTLYLLLVALLMGLMFLFPLMWFSTEGGQIELGARFLMQEGVCIGQTPIYLAILLALALLLPLVVIFLYKRRMLQLRLCAVEAVLLVGLLCMEAMLYWGPQALERGALMPTSFIPVAALFLVWLAARGIFKDEMLVRSLSRIR
uniref:DUF4293 domain-containing protein n=1 Tax=Alistipes sp. TaxID=1872444 RepID=UPI00405707AC